MGYNAVELRATSRVSNHNSPRDSLDNKAWNQFVRQVKALAETHDRLFIDVWGDDDLDEETYCCEECNRYA